MSDALIFRALNYTIYILPISMITYTILTDKSIEDTIVPITLLLLLIVIGFEILHDRYILLPKEICSKYIHDKKNEYEFTKNCYILVSKIFYLNATISFSILFITSLFTCNTTAVQLILLMATIFSASRTSLTRLLQIKKR